MWLQQSWEILMVKKWNIKMRKKDITDDIAFEYHSNLLPS